MHAILHAEHAALAAREAELVRLLDEAGTHSQAIADRANAEIAAVRQEIEHHAEELAGIRHSKATIARLQAQVTP